MPALPRFRWAIYLQLAWLVPTLFRIFFYSGHTSVPADKAKPEPVKLAVVVVFDQLRGDYPIRWQELFGDDGFRRLAKEGVWFQNCHYPYAGTVTSAGHASIATGTSPDVHGIIGNEWYDRAAGEDVYSSSDPRYTRVPPAPEKTPKKDAAETEKATKKLRKGGGSPDLLLAPTIADALKLATADKGRVFSLSLKDRSAVLPGGRKPDGCYWFDSADGKFVTSTYYRDRVHPWIEAINKEKVADFWFGKKWEYFKPDLDYVKWSGPDDVKGEALGFGQGRTFPHPMDGGLKEPGKNYYDALTTSPMGNHLLLEAAKRAIDEEKLGAGATSDLLLVSFSSNDLVGHAWGPDSQEVLDMTLRTDRIIAALLEHLDKRVGKGKYTLVLSADHGICPLPEVAASQGKDAGRASATKLVKDAEAFLTETFDKGDAKSGAKGYWIEDYIDESFYLNKARIKTAGVEQAKVEEALAKWAITRPFVQTAYTRTQLLAGPIKDDPIGQRVRRSFFSDRSGDVMIVLKPYYLMTTRLTGTSHGSPHSYDTHVPLMVFGPNLEHGIRTDAVTPQACTPILAHALSIKPPAKCDTAVPEKLFVD